MFRRWSVLMVMGAVCLSSCTPAKEDRREGRTESTPVSSPTQTQPGTPTGQGQTPPAGFGFGDTQRIKKARADCITLVSALKHYALEHDGQYPPAGDWSQLTTLPTKPPLDPWNRPYQWYLVSTAGPDGVDVLVPVVWSTGPQGLFGPKDECSSDYDPNKK